ncbi:MAG TPA: phosphoribosylformylglycinamidine cyclo-ligase [Clostridiales bacterium]|nr:MAG: Phosphoribosylformylglycinamidine cyclo-ligase [Firmicutes bacterium ADurb.Bin262]HOU11380.1 phosphoribosylformylglycinamidine cyclo-ligase [Clostridiales bacterium]HQH62297.1 phosphoribosylformylglycinamidine cyclo-ligase [Clostridiales bacterium]HQK73426.1 phosphoribosylformylglycinamidine cyclo-ligase [Clostridiales bacterium]
MGTDNSSYKNAGVDVHAGYRSVELIKKHVARTKIPGVVSDIGGFGGLFKPDLNGIKSPVLVSGTDGVGTKLKVAFLMDKHDTVGIDCVAMCVNDVVCSGAKPLFFLDYLAVGKNIPEKIADIVSGVADGCREAGCALIGGETAEMPGFYPPEEYDLAGFCVGLADMESIRARGKVRPGDILIGLPSSGVHSNGFSLVRKLFNISEERLRIYVADFGKTLGEELLMPTRIYVTQILQLFSAVDIHGVSHITGGGFFENIPRMLPQGLCAQIAKRNIPRLAVFSAIQAEGVPERDMYNTFNMGMGMCVCVAEKQAHEAFKTLEACGEKPFEAGCVKEGDDGVLLI